VITLGDLAFQLLAANVAALGKGDIQWLATDHLVIHFWNGLGSLVRGRETNKSKAFGCALLVTHNFAAGDGTEGFELATEFIVIHIILEILDVQVNTLVLALLLSAGLFVRTTELFVAFRFLLGTRDVEILAMELGVVQLINGFLSVLVFFVVHKAETLALAILVKGEHRRRDGTVLLHQLREFILGDLEFDVLDVEVSELRLHFIDFGLALLKHHDGSISWLPYTLKDMYLARNVVSNKDLLVVQQHTIDSFDCGLGSFCCLIVNEPVSTRVTSLISSNFAREDISERDKRVVKSLYHRPGQMGDGDRKWTMLNWVRGVPAQP
jgi:hypothetical protein